MADIKHTNEQRNPNQTMQQEKAKAEVGGHRQDERDKLDQERHKTGGIGSAETRSKTGEPGRARSEIDQNKKEPTGQQR
jgi:hypothetical protein